MIEGGHEQTILFEVSTPLGFRVRVTRSYWELITTIKHPVMAGQEVMYGTGYPQGSGTNPIEPQRQVCVPLLQAGTSRAMDLCCGQKTER